MTEQTGLPPTAGPEIDGRTRHYGGFYGVDPLPEDDGRPLVVCWGNCQAEAIRQLLDGAPSTPVRSVRIPPVHEIEASDLPHVRRLLAATDVLLAQPVAAGYRGMALGTDEVATLLPERGRVVRWPVLFDASLYPFQVLVRQPDLGDPPVVPYHDLRTIVEAATGRRPETPDVPEVYLALAEASRRSLAHREEAHGTLRVSDAFERRDGGWFHTINHPGNPMLLTTAHLIQEELGVPQDAADPGRILLRSVLTPQEPHVFAALGLTPDSDRDQWILGGERVDDEVVREAQLAFYREHPGFVAEGLNRHRATLEALGIGPA